MIVLFAINILNFYDRNIGGALVEPQRLEFGLNDTQVGLLGTAFTILYAIIGVPLGRFADVWSRRKLLGIGLAVWSSLTAATYYVHSFGGLMFTRLGVGVGEAACAPTATSWLGDLVAPAKRARTLGFFMLAVPVGGALSYFFGGPTAKAYGWRIAMVMAAVPALLLIPALLFLREPQRGASEGAQAAKATSTLEMFGVLKIPTLLWIIASGALLNFNMYAIGTFMPAMFGRIFHLNVGQAGVKTGIVYMVGGVIGGLGAGWVGDHIIHVRRNGRLMMGALFAFLGAPLAYLGAQADDLTTAIIFWSAAYAMLNTYYALVYSSIQEIVGPSQRGSAMALYFMAMYLCGASFGPLITGRLSDYLAMRWANVTSWQGVADKIHDAARAHGLQQAMLIIPAFQLGLAIVLYLASQTVVRDIARREAKAAAPAIA
jgi:MFS family permease